MARRSTGRTATIWKRTIKVYVPELEDVQAWTRRAQKAGKSLSEYILELAERGREERFPTREQERIQELEHRVESLQSRVQELSEELRWKTGYLRSLDAENRQLRASSRPRLRPGRSRIRPQVVRLLKERGSIQERDLFRQLGLPPDSQEAVEVTNQLELLERGGAVERTGNGWRLLLQEASP